MSENEDFKLKAILGSMLSVVYQDEILKIQESFLSIAKKVDEILVFYGLEEDWLTEKVLADMIAFILTHGFGNDFKENQNDME